MAKQGTMNNIANMLLDIAQFYGYELEDRQLEMYVEVLSQWDESKVLEAGLAYVRNPKNDRFPVPPHKILADMMPQVEAIDIARHTAGRVVAAVTKFGIYQAAEAKEFIGSVGWRAVENFGGWQYLCENLGVSLQVTTFQAQCRDAIQAELNLKKAGMNPNLPALEQSNREILAPGRVADVVKSLTISKQIPEEGENEKD